MELLWTPEAVQDRDEIYDYIDADNPQAALSLDELFSAGARRLLSHPHSGRPGRVPDTMELVVHGSYMLVYELRGSQIRILAVVHTARCWPSPGPA
ncbi:type II toxin-antitoxin system RelE/ParE family toxin [Alkalilimnicola sp. S0819]|uniref:type II toxin-antitoxin system RelE/ParE family toxin n=1 Tax=Alkalilimnicola sp. S0819 TaxID=2613922 RepID=UPI0012623526|nr:type II toxin-antitoxin system RelE/ParE family toxin [Alkalilimnicola sp. S0819]KAB7627846.1 type II toxin-antitoxin system RelE/ParE family toxin [Alkalilimnicola sp. S0819]MPQ15480.1 type II toxin-antitoxin system mRNA interferase toxin, RelE/StbE family [Alkalilimnicola sp. S0819]